MMEDDVKVTVYCITYNQEKYIRKCLESLVSQKTNFRYEILVHDDASTDNTPEIIREFTQKYFDIIKPILQTENQFSKGINIARVYLHPLTKGKYVATCEGDDYWADENKLQMQFDIMESNPNLSLCVHRVQCVNEDGSINDRVIPEEKYSITRTGHISQDEFADLLFLRGGYPFHTSSYFRKKEVIEGKIFIGLPTTLNGDQKVLYSSLYAGDVYYIDKPMSHRRLMAIGSYNSRLKEKGPEERQKKLLNTIRAEIEFDKLSEQRYHKKIIYCDINRFYALFQKSNRKTIISEFKAFDKQMKYDWKISYKLNIRYVMLKYFPLLIPIVKFLRR